MSLRPNTHLQTITMNETVYSTLKDIHENATTDADTVVTGKQKMITRLQLMVSTAATKQSAEALLMSTKNLLSALKNKVKSIKFIKWNEQSNKAKGTDHIPKSVEKAEEYIYNFSRFSKSQKGYYRVSILHDVEEAPQENILAQAKQFNIKKQQYISLADSQAINPVTIGLLVGTTEEMNSSPDLLALFTKESSVESIGIVWKYIQTGVRGKYDNNQKALYIETEQRDTVKLQAFMHKNINDDQIKIFGCPLTFLPSNSYPTKSQQTKLKKYAPTQASLVGSVRSTEIEVAILKEITYKSREDKKITTTLAQALTEIQSIHVKQGVTRDKILSFYGNLFYAIVPNYETNHTTFQYLPSNEEEAESVLKALPLFVKEHFQVSKLQAESYCRSKHITKALNGQWDFSQRSFKTQQDIKEEMFFENLQLLTQSNTSPDQPAQYIDPEHQRMMTGKGIDNDTTCTNLHQKQTKATNNDVMEVDMESTTNEDNADKQHNHATNQSTTSSLTSINTGSTKTSKAQRFAEETRKEMTHQMMLKQREHEQEMKKRDEQYKLMEHKLQQLLAMQTNTQAPKEVIAINDNSDGTNDTEMEVEFQSPGYGSQTEDSNEYSEDDDLSEDEEEYEAQSTIPLQTVTPLKDDDDKEELRGQSDSDNEMQELERRNSDWKTNWKKGKKQQDDMLHQSTDNPQEEAPGAHKRKQTSQNEQTSNKKAVAGGPGDGSDW